MTEDLIDDRKIRNDEDDVAPCRKEESRLERMVNETSPTPSVSFAGGCGSSSSRRKNALPQRQPVGVDDEEGTPQIEQNEMVGEETVANEALEQQIETTAASEAPKNVLAASLATSINPQVRPLFICY
ncbi:unnamed protein product [Gongylonema pulchrum]|uniref:Uncharacterized protein n=1 Tax=Gongylonema pulchrum TaxID=637853 RepID=A0A183DHA8_9BILA|nr:unnamed protein product [Gongylonema pulchrum]